MSKDPESTENRPSEPTLSSEQRQRYEEALREWNDRTRTEQEAIRRSEQLTESDLAVRINTRD